MTAWGQTNPMSLIHTEYRLLENNFKKKPKQQHTATASRYTEGFHSQNKKYVLIVFSLR